MKQKSNTKIKFFAATMAFLALGGVGVASISTFNADAASKTPKVAKVVLSGGGTIDTGKYATKKFTATITMSKEKILTGAKRVNLCNTLQWSSSNKKVATVKPNKDGKASGAYSATCTATITAVKGAGTNAVSTIRAYSNNGKKYDTKKIHLALNTGTAPTVTGLTNGAAYYSNTTGTFKSSILSGTQYYIAKKTTGKDRKCPAFEQPKTKWENAKSASSYKVSASNGKCTRYWIVVRSKDNYTKNWTSTRTIKVTVNKIVDTPTISTTNVNMDNHTVSATITAKTTGNGAATYYTTDGSNPADSTNKSRKSFTSASSVISFTPKTGSNVPYTIKAVTIRGGGTSNVATRSGSTTYTSESSSPQSGNSNLKIDEGSETSGEEDANVENDPDPTEAQDETEIGDDDQKNDDASSDLEEGTYTEEKTVHLGDNTEGTKIYYTLDGSEPTENSTLYTGGIKLALPTEGSKEYVLKVLSIDADGNRSTATYTYTMKAPSVADDEDKDDTEEGEDGAIEEAAEATTAKAISAPKTGFAKEADSQFNFGLVGIIAAVILALGASIYAIKRADNNRSIRL